ncbi:MAG: LysE family translocator [Porticoccaceae bacterium]|nr:LysE family translocator [Porticoccaceae bacterium]
MDIILQNSSSAMFWVSVSVACLLGAMSPGPSLALIVNHSLSQGKIAGLCAALAHGLGISIFAFITAFGLVVAVDKNPLLFDVIQVLGSLFLFYLAVKLLFSPIKRESGLSMAVKSSYWAAARDGFLIALINPKILIFFTALFSQFVRVESANWEKLALTAMAGGIDALWYMLVVLLVSHSRAMVRFQRKSWVIDKVFSLILFVISITFISQILERGDFAQFL